MTRQEIVSFLADRQAMWVARDTEGMSATHAANGTVDSPMFGALRGRNEIAESYRSLFTIFPDWEMTNHDALVDGQRIAEPFSATATHVREFMGLAGTHRRFQIQGIRLYELAGDVIQHERRLYDFTALLIQIGVLRGKPAK